VQDRTSIQTELQHQLPHPPIDALGALPSTHLQDITSLPSTNSASALFLHLQKNPTAPKPLSFCLPQVPISPRLTFNHSTSWESSTHAILREKIQGPLAAALPPVRQKPPSNSLSCVSAKWKRFQGENVRSPQSLAQVAQTPSTTSPNKPLGNAREYRAQDHEVDRWIRLEIWISCRSCCCKRKEAPRLTLNLIQRPQPQRASLPSNHQHRVELPSICEPHDNLKRYHPLRSLLRPLPKW
jgi:hypothetical protein